MDGFNSGLGGQTMLLGGGPATTSSAQVGSGLAGNVSLSGGVGSPATGGAITLIIVLGGLFLVYMASRRLEGT